MHRIRSEPDVLQQSSAADRNWRRIGESASSQEEQRERPKVPGSARSDNYKVRYSRTVLRPGAATSVNLSTVICLGYTKPRKGSGAVLSHVFLKLAIVLDLA